MICKNCNYILSGSESFCPDCGTPCEKDRSYQKEQPQVIFSPEKETSSPIFAADPQPVILQREKKSRAGLYLVIVLCAVILGTVAVTFTDIEAFTPAIASLFSFTENEAEPEAVTGSSEYDPLSGTVYPAVSYKTTVAYISGERGQALRKGPDNSYGQTELLPVGTKVHIIGSEKSKNDWVYVYVPEEDIYGWLSASYISSYTVGADEEESEFHEETEAYTQTEAATDIE